jgi:hypothetical protein
MGGSRLCGADCPPFCTLYWAEDLDRLALHLLASDCKALEKIKARMLREASE